MNSELTCLSSKYVLVIKNLTLKIQLTHNNLTNNQNAQSRQILLTLENTSEQAAH